MSDDIIKQLETMWLAKEPKLLWGDMQAITDLAAFEIEALRAEKEKLRAALKQSLTQLTNASVILEDFHKGWPTLKNIDDVIVNITDTLKEMGDE